MPNIKKTFNLGIYGAAGNKITQLLLRRMGNSSRPPKDWNERRIFNKNPLVRAPSPRRSTPYDVYRMWSFIEYKREPTGEAVINLDGYLRHPGSYDTGFADSIGLADITLDDIRKYLICEAAWAIQDNADKPAGEVHIFGANNPANKVKADQLECYVGFMTGQTAEQLAAAYGEKIVKSVVGASRDPMKVELHLAVEEEAARLEHEFDMKKNDLWDEHWTRVNAMQAEIDKKIDEMKTATIAAVEAAKKAMHEKIKALRKELR